METKTLIAVVTCRTRLHTWAQCIRDTWMPLVPKDRADVVFFIGRREGLHDTALDILPTNVVSLDCNDAYEGLPDKVKSIARWAKARGYSYMLKCDDDVVLKPVALLNSGYNLSDYTGRANRPPQPYVVPMGFNYWLSKKCIEIVSEAPLPANFDDEKWVARNLWNHGIELVDDLRYALHTKLLEPPPPKRPIRAPSRLVYVDPEKEPNYFSRCIYLQEPLDVKLAEFKKVFARYGGI